MYTQAMSKGLYHAVNVHGPQGRQGTAKAYACTNCMEFFAEISTAYMWNNVCLECNELSIQCLTTVNEDKTKSTVNDNTETEMNVESIIPAIPTLPTVVDSSVTSQSTESEIFSESDEVTTNNIQLPPPPPVEVTIATGTDSEKEIEYNKWYPFNRRQLVNYDYETYMLVEKLWNQQQ